MLVGSVAIGFQGLCLAAIGEGLWLIAGIHEHSQRTAERLLTLGQPPQQM